MQLVTREGVKPSKEAKKPQKTPISQMAIAEVSELSGHYENTVEYNKARIYEIIGSIRSQIEPEYLEALLFGCVIVKDELIILKKGVEVNEEDIKFGFNAFKGFLAIESQMEVGVLLSKEQLDGKRIFIPFKDIKLSDQLNSLAECGYWGLHASNKLEACKRRINELTKGEDTTPKTDLMDFLSETNCSDADEQDLKK